MKAPISERDQARTALELIRERGLDAAIFAAEHADEALEAGDFDELNRWKAVIAIIRHHIDEQNITQH